MSVAMDWNRQGAGLVSTIELRDGREGKVVLVGSRDNPKGAMLVLASEASQGAQAVSLVNGIRFLHPQQLVEILCAQERAFGSSGLNPVELS